MLCQGDLRALWAAVPKYAQLVRLSADGVTPDMASVRTAPATDIPIGSLVLVKGGEQARRGFLACCSRPLASTCRCTDTPICPVIFCCILTPLCR